MLSIDYIISSLERKITNSFPLFHMFVLVTSLIQSYHFPRVSRLDCPFMSPFWLLLCMLQSRRILHSPYSILISTMHASNRGISPLLVITPFPCLNSSGKWTSYTLESLLESQSCFRSRGWGDGGMGCRGIIPLGGNLAIPWGV